MVKKCFNGDVVFDRARQLAFETFLNRDRGDTGKVTMAEMMAAYTDTVLRKGGSVKLQESEFDEFVAKIVLLFTHLIDKDLFIEVFRSYLAKRLLNDKSQSSDNEKIMISHIKMSCGLQFTKKLEGMLTDLALANEESKKFVTYCETTNQAVLSTDFKVTILTTSYWPSYKTYELTIPKELESCVKAFNVYY
jgi:cullin 1